MPAALAKRAESLAGDVRSQLRDKNVRHAGISREVNNIVIRFRDAETRDKARTIIAEQLPDLQLADAGSGNELRLVATHPPRGAEEDAGVGAQAEHPDPAQPHQRAGRRRARDPAAGRGPGGGAASRRPGHRQGQGNPRQDRDAGGPDGGRREHERRGPGGGAGRTGALRRRILRRAERPAAARAQAGRPDRRPADRRAAGLRQPDPGTGRPPHPRLHRRAHLQGRDARERQQAHGDPAHRERPGRGRHGAGDPLRDRRRAACRSAGA